MHDLHDAWFVYPGLKSSCNRAKGFGDSGNPRDSNLIPGISGAYLAGQVIDSNVYALQSVTESGVGKQQRRHSVSCTLEDRENQLARGC